jgi:RNA polymerase sigma-70 factor (ECF subfamily)
MDATDTLVEVLKGEGPRVLATLARTVGDLAVAEDALSEATITALDAWPKTGIPDNPRAWLAVVARRKALDLLRRESARSAKETAAFRWGTEAAPDQIEEAIEAMEPETSLRDDMLRLIFTCCHPALGREAQVALSLRTLARLEVPAIARAFLVPEATMAKRLVRVRSKIATARIPYAIPSDTELPGRLAAVLAVVYLIATEAHAPTGGDAVARVDLEAEAIRLARLLASLMPDEPETLSLLALLLLTSARTSARTDADGNPVTLADQPESARPSRLTRSDMRSLPACSTPACPCATCKRRPRTPIRGPRCGMTVPAAAWTGMPPTLLLPTSRAPLGKRAGEYPSWRPAPPGGASSSSSAGKVITPSDLRLNANRRYARP